MTLPDYLDWNGRPPCPWCDSRTGFALYYKTHSLYECGSYYCFKCLRYGDGLSYLIEAEGRTFPEALAALGLQDLTPAPAWAYQGPRLHHEPSEPPRAAQRTPSGPQEPVETIRTDWSMQKSEVLNCTLHGEMGLPARLRGNPAAVRYANALEDQSKDKALRRKARRLEQEAYQDAINRTALLMERHLCSPLAIVDRWGLDHNEQYAR